MERYVPPLSHSYSPKHNTLDYPTKYQSKKDQYQDYMKSFSYIYGTPLRQRIYEDIEAPKQPSLNSMKTLLSMNSRKNYGPTYHYNSLNLERSYDSMNVEDRLKTMRCGTSAASLNRSLIEEEFKNVQNSHKKTLGELNLEIEEMLMSDSQSTSKIKTSESTSSETSNSSSTSTVIAANSITQNDVFFKDLMNNHLIDVEIDTNRSGTLRNYNNNILDSVAGKSEDIDSGFGSLGHRRKANKSAPIKIPNRRFPSETATKCCNYNNDFYTHCCHGSCSHSSFNDYGTMSHSLNNKLSKSQIDPTTTPKKQSFLMSQLSKFNNSINSSPTHAKQTAKPKFWKSKMWLKLPKFSSTSSINKTDANSE